MNTKFKKVTAALTAVATVATATTSITSTTISASAAAPSLYITSSQLTQNEVVNFKGANVVVPSSYYRIDINIKNNTSYVGFGLSATLSNCNVLTYQSLPVVKKGLSDCEVAITSDKKLCSFTSASGSSNDGTILSFYVKKGSSSYITLGITEFSNGKTNIITPNVKYSSSSIVTSNSCIIGDASGDFVVNSNDAVLIKQKAGISVKTLNANMGYFFPKIKIAHQVDVNNDGYVNNTDATQILEYYAKSITGAAYTTNLEIGKRYYI